MELKQGKHMTLLCGEILQFWIGFRTGVSLSEIRVINKIFFYYDNNLDCGHIPSSALSKILKNWLTECSISTKKSSKDKRRNFYYPSANLVKHRETLFTEIQCIINKS